MKSTTIWKLSMLVCVAVFATACKEKTEKVLAEEVSATETLNFEDLKTKESYVVGIGAGKSMKANIESIQGTSIELDIDVIAQAFADGLKGESKLDEAAVTDVMNKFRTRVSEAMQAKRVEEQAAQKKVAEENIIKGTEFLATNKTKEGVVTTESGLQYKVLKAGTGQSPSATDKVKVHYTGTLIDGSKFDSSRDRDEPTTFGVNRVIKGWTEALMLMKEGSRWELYIPANIAYGEISRPKIPGNSVLVFDVELIKIVEKVAPK